MNNLWAKTVSYIFTSQSIKLIVHKDSESI